MMGRVQPGEDAADLGDVDPEAADELMKIRRRGGGLLVPVSSPPAPPAGGYVDVANFDSLAHLARSYQLMILHHQRGDAHSFYIDDDGSIYRYGVRAGERHAQVV